MALLFGGATSDRVSIAAAASINVSEASIVSVLVRFNVSTFTTNRYIVAKNAVDGNGGFRVDTFSGGELRVRMSCATVDAEVRSNSLALSTGVWYDGHFVYDHTDAQEAHIYLATAGADSWTEPTYAVNTNHTGATATNPALTWGNSSAGSPTAALQGSIAMGQWKVGAVHTARERRIWQRGLGELVSAGCTMNLGWPGTGTQHDLSGNGNNGTVTGATFTAQPPLAMPFWNWQSEGLPYIVAATPATGQPTIKRWAGVPGMRIAGATFGQGWGT